MMEPLPINVDEKLNTLKEKFSWVDLSFLENISKNKNIQYICYSPTIDIPYIEDNGGVSIRSMFSASMVVSSTNCINEIYCIYTIVSNNALTSGGLMMRGITLPSYFNILPSKRDEMINSILS